MSQPSRFFDVTGKRLVLPAKVGLTCASFVLAVFDAAGLPLADYETWPEPNDEDIRHQKELLEFLSSDPKVTREHIASFSIEIGNVRYRPLEVAAAATADSLPSNYFYSARVAEEIAKVLSAIERPSNTS